MSIEVAQMNVVDRLTVAIQRIDVLEAQNAELLAALEFYAADNNWIGSEGGTIPAIKEGGIIARAAIEKAKREVFK